MEINTENYFDAACALHWYCCNYHGGQWSAEYRIMCELDYTPSPLENEPRSEEEAEIYKMLVAGELDPQETLEAIQQAHELTR